MGTGVLAIAFRPQLVTLIARPADPPPNRPCCPGRSSGGPIWMLPVLWLRPSPGEVRVMDADVLLELLEGIVGAGRE